VKVEILPPDAQVPEAVRVPHVSRAWEQIDDDSVYIQLRDGGVWQITRHAVADIPPSLVRMGLAEVFAARPASFDFKRRARR
jgi:hypothetical protein